MITSSSRVICPVSGFCYSYCMIHANNETQREVIGLGYIEDRPTKLAKVRAFLSRATLGIVRPPQDRKFLHTSDGKVFPIRALVSSAEGVRLGGADVLATETDGFHDPLAVQIGLGVGAVDLPADGWPKEAKPEVIKQLLGYLDDIEE